MIRRFAVALLALAAALGAWPTLPASAQTAATITLESSAPTVVYGQRVTLSGSISPASAGQAVDIRDQAEVSVATATTDASGDFSVELRPSASLTLHAVWDTAVSAPISLGVRAVLSVSLPPVHLFGRITVRGTVAPARAGRKVEVRLIRNGTVALTRRVPMGPMGRFAAAFEVEQPGTYRARAAFSASDLLQGVASAGPRATPLPALQVGSRGPVVELLERRLLALHYRLTGVDDVFDYRTADALIAFHKVQGMPRTGAVDAATWRALADPFVPKPRSSMKRFHIEVDQTRQVLYTVENREITNILHVSTGKPSTPTHDGTFSVYSKCPCLTPLGLYYPSFFDGQRALHGYVVVPTYAASHGCVRIPYWNARWVYGVAAYGTPVVIYH